MVLEELQDHTYLPDQGEPAFDNALLVCLYEGSKCVLAKRDSREPDWTYHDASSPSPFEYVLDLSAWAFQDLTNSAKVRPLITDLGGGS
jgi:hypothetical protein